MTFYKNRLLGKYCLVYKFFLVVNLMASMERLIKVGFLFFLLPNRSVLRGNHFNNPNLWNHSLSNIVQKDRWMNLHSDWWCCQLRKRLLQRKSMMQHNILLTSRCSIAISLTNQTMMVLLQSITEIEWFFKEPNQKLRLCLILWIEFPYLTSLYWK